MGEKIVLSPKKELGYERIVTKLKKVWGGLLKGWDNRCKEGDWIGLLEENKAFWSMVCCASSTFRPECSNNVQHLYIPQDIKLYLVGSQSRTLSLINDGMSKGVVEDTGQKCCCNWHSSLESTVEEEHSSCSFVCFWIRMDERLEERVTHKEEDMRQVFC